MGNPVDAAELARNLSVTIRRKAGLPAPYGYVLDEGWYDPSQGGDAFQAIAFCLLMRQGKNVVTAAETANLAAALRAQAA